MTPKYLAIFVEGKTEFIFIRKLLIEIAGQNNIEIQGKVLQGSSRCPEIENFTDTDAKYKILLRNSCADHKVLSDMKENYENLVINKGYTKIIGIRDLFPTPYEKKDRVKNRILQMIQNENLDHLKMILAVMEIETWFIAETKHYQNIDEVLDLNYIKNHSGLDLESMTNFEGEFIHPAETLHQIYSLSNKAWRKKESQIIRTVDSLDYENLYIKVAEHVPSLKEFLKELDQFFI
jgi:hypothetical protein